MGLQLKEKHNSIHCADMKQGDIAIIIEAAINI